MRISSLVLHENTRGLKVDAITPFSVPLRRLRGWILDGDHQAGHRMNSFDISGKLGWPKPKMGSLSEPLIVLSSPESNL